MPRLLKSHLYLYIVLSASPYLFSQQTDLFYLSALEKAQQAFLAHQYQAAVKDFEIAVFGITQDNKLRAKAYVYLGLSQYYLNDVKGCEKSLQEAAGLLGKDGFAGLQIYETAWPDLEKLLGFFNISLAKNDILPKEIEKPKESDANPPPIAKQTLPPEANRTNDSSNAGSMDPIKEGDLVPLGLVEARPIVLKRVEAVYPAWARTYRIEGTVVVNALVSENVKVFQTQILQEIKGGPGFTQAAERAVRQWKFDPATIKGIKVKVWMPISIEFKKQILNPDLSGL